MGWGEEGKAGLQMSQVQIRTEDAVYKSQWPIQKNAGDRYTDIKRLFFRIIWISDGRCIIIQGQ